MYKKGFDGWRKHLDFMAIDMLCMIIALWGAFLTRHGFKEAYFGHIPYYMHLMAVLLVVSFLVAYFFNTFSGVIRRGYYKELLATLRHIALVVLIAFFYLFSAKKTEDYSRIILYLFGIYYFVLSYGTRVLWRKHLWKQGDKNGERSILLITESDQVSGVLESLRTHKGEQLSITGVVLLDKACDLEAVEGIPVVSDLKNVVNYVCREWVDEVFIRTTGRSVHIEKLTEQFLEMGVTVHQGLFRNEDADSERKQFVEKLGNYTVLTSSINAATPFQLFAKRTLDILGGIVGCICTGLIYIVIAPMIKKESPGPVFFSTAFLFGRCQKFIGIFGNNPLKKAGSIAPGLLRHTLLQENHVPGDGCQILGTAHGHGVLQLGTDLVDVQLHAFLSAAVDHGDEGAADDDSVSAHSQSLEDIHAGTDAAVDDDLHAAALQGVHDVTQDLSGGGALVQNTAAMVADHDTGSAGFLGLQGTLDGHDTLDDEGLTGHFGDGSQLLYGLAAGGGIHTLQEGQTGSVYIHGNGEGAGGLDQFHLAFDGFQIPGLDSGDTDAVGSSDGFTGDLHNGGIQTVTGESGDTVVSAGLDQNVVVALVIVLVAVVSHNSAYGTGEEGITELFAEEFQRGVGGAGFAEGIHVHTDLLPLAVVAHGSIANALGAGAGNAVAAGLAVADGAGLALVLGIACVCQNFLISHNRFLPECNFYL